MKLGELVTQYRHENGISQREFARRANLSNSLISLIEKGYNPQTGKKMAPDIETYQSVARVMGISLQELFESLDEDESVYINYFRYNNVVGRTPVFIPNTETFIKLTQYMPEEDYQLVMRAFEKAAQRMKEAEGETE